MLTALHDVSHRIRGIEVGADDFLTKPFNREELLTRVKSLLRIKHFMMTSRRRTVLLRRVIGRYVSEEVAAEIVADPGRHLKLGGEKREVTVLFGDCAASRPWLESALTPDVVEILNVYLSHVVSISSLSFAAILTSFAATASWHSSARRCAHGDDTASAVRCALALQERLKSISPSRSFPTSVCRRASASTAAR